MLKPVDIRLFGAGFEGIGSMTKAIQE